MIKGFRTMCAAAGLLLATVVGVQAADVGTAAPEFATQQIFTGKPVSNADYKGKNLVISFFNTTCSACESEIKMLDAMRQQYAGAFDIVLACTDFVTPRFTENMNGYIGRMGLSSYTIVSDAKTDLLEKFGFTATPSMVGIDKDGKIAFLMAGFGRKDGQILDGHLKKMAGK